MSTVTIDGIEYSIENMSEDAKNQLMNLQYVQTQLNDLNAKLAVFKTAEIAYTIALKAELEKND